MFIKCDDGSLINSDMVREFFVSRSGDLIASFGNDEHAVVCDGEFVHPKLNGLARKLEASSPTFSDEDLREYVYDKHGIEFAIFVKEQSEKEILGSDLIKIVKENFDEKEEMLFYMIKLFVSAKRVNDELYFYIKEDEC